MNSALASYAGLTVDVQRSRVSYTTAAILAPQEARLLAAFLARPGQVITSETLIGAMYPEPDEEPEDALQGVRIVLSRMRAKLRIVGVELDISNAYRIGYALDAVRFIAKVPLPVRVA